MKRTYSSLVTCCAVCLLVLTSNHGAVNADPMNPEPAIFDAAAGELANGQVIVSGSVDGDLSSLVLEEVGSGASATINGDGTFSVTVSGVSDGDVLVFVATDVNGESAEYQVTVTATAGPAAPVITGAQGALDVNADGTITGTVTGTGAIVVRETTSGAECLVNANGTFTLFIPDCEPGPAYIVASIGTSESEQFLLYIEE
ncbi:MAG: hypothetical protein KDB14_22840 [Planctomycetales bacterium]|nr:hypothetical protein [Planctomycetales bacterium]